MDIKKKHSLALAIIVLSCFLLLAGACENAGDFGTEGHPVEQSGDVLLSLTADIVPPVAPETRAVTSIEGFKETSYSFGLSITKDNEAKGEVFTGAGDMTAVMSRPSTSTETWNWSFKNNKTTSQIPESDVTVPAGKPLRIIAYYPSITGAGAFSDGIPFDFTEVRNPMQKEILYNVDTACTVQASAGNKAVVPLKFQHAYSWIVINITKYINKGTQQLSSVSIENLLGERIKNKGKINPATGLCMPGAVAGPIGESRDPVAIPFNTTGVEPIKYEFLVPAFMDPSVSNENIIITMMIDGTKEIFPLQRLFLNMDGDKYGFRQGYKNTYNIVFDNSALSLRLLSWSSAVITEDFGTTETFSNKIGVVNYNDRNNFPWTEETIGLKKSSLEYDKSLYDNYLSTVAYGNNGKYVTVNRPTKAPIKDEYICEDDNNVQSEEHVYSLTWITMQNVSAVSVPWEDENGQLVAKELCRKYSLGGYHDWRLPRASELRGVMIFASNSANAGTIMGLKSKDHRALFWTATEVDENQAWTASYYDDSRAQGTQYRGPLLYPQDKKKVKAFVRCVRIPKTGEVLPTN